VYIILKSLGIVAFKYMVSVETVIEVQMSSYVMPFGLFTKVSKADIYQYLSIIFAIFTIYGLKKKYDLYERVGKTISKNIFLILFYMVLFFEIIYKQIFWLSGLLNYTDFPSMTPESRMNVIFMYENVKILKGFSIFFLTIHCGFVLFNSRDLEVYMIFSKAAFQRFVITIFLIVGSYAFIVYQILGYDKKDYSNFWKALTNIFLNILGLKNVGFNLNDGFGTTETTYFYLHLGEFLFTQIVIKLSLAIMLYYYGKIAVKKAKQDEKEKFEKDIRLKLIEEDIKIKMKMMQNEKKEAWGNEGNDENEI